MRRRKLVRTPSEQSNLTSTISSSDEVQITDMRIQFKKCGIELCISYYEGAACETVDLHPSGASGFTYSIVDNSCHSIYMFDLLLLSRLHFFLLIWERISSTLLITTRSMPLVVDYNAAIKHLLCHTFVRIGF